MWFFSVDAATVALEPFPDQHADASRKDTAR